MKFSEQWLREWAKPPFSTDELVQQLTMVGLEVDGVEPVAGDFSGVVVGQIMTVSPHPQADRLNLCKVTTNGHDVLSIVCGASNVYPKMIVAVALMGAVLPGGLTIKKTKLRGELSEGMLCSASELGLEIYSEGIL